MGTDVTFEVTTGFITVSMIAVLWALWVRRHTWGHYYEKAATAAVLINGLGMALATPFSSNTIGRAGLWLTGEGNLNTLGAHWCVLGGTASFTLHMLQRKYDLGDELRREYYRKVNLPLTLAIPIMLAALVESKANNVQYPDLLDVHPDIWLYCYWIEFTFTLLYLEIYLALILIHLHSDRRSRRFCNAYLVAVVLAVIGIAIRMATLAYNDTNSDNSELMWLFGSLCLTVFCIGVGLSWKFKYRRVYEQEWQEGPARPEPRVFRREHDQ
jgi:hypothetical protein